MSTVLDNLEIKVLIRGNS